MLKKKKKKRYYLLAKKIDQIEKEQAEIRARFQTVSLVGGEEERLEDIVVPPDRIRTAFNVLIKKRKTIKRGKNRKKSKKKKKKATKKKKTIK